MKNIKDSILNGLTQAIEYERDNNTKVKRRVIMISPIKNYSGDEIKSIRNKLNLTQSAFAEVMGVAVKTVEAWESGKNTPQGPAQRVLELIVKDSSMVDKFIYAK